VYQPLDENIASFRLLALHPRSHGGGITCNLAHDTWQNGTEYDALSYAWGSTLNKKRIELNGKPFLVTENLHSALEHLQGRDQARTIWIDALCIDQENTNERNH